MIKCTNSIGALIFQSCRYILLKSWLFLATLRIYPLDCYPMHWRRVMEAKLGHAPPSPLLSLFLKSAKDKLLALYSPLCPAHSQDRSVSVELEKLVGTPSMPLPASCTSIWSMIHSDLICPDLLLCSPSSCSRPTVGSGRMPTALTWADGLRRWGHYCSTAHSFLASRRPCPMP